MFLDPVKTLMLAFSGRLLKQIFSSIVLLQGPSLFTAHVSYWFLILNVDLFIRTVACPDIMYMLDVTSNNNYQSVIPAGVTVSEFEGHIAPIVLAY